jgi:hypothetical protein
LFIVSRVQQIYALYTAFFLAAHRAFIIADSFFRMAGLIGRRPVDFFAGDAGFLGADLCFHFAQRFFCAADILALAAALILRLAGTGCEDCDLGGRPRRGDGTPNPSKAEIALLSRSRSILR